MLRLGSFAVVLIIFCCPFAFSADPAPSEASIRELLAVTQVRKQIDVVMAHVEGLMNASMEQLIDRQSVTPDKRKIMENMNSKGIALLRQEMGWESYEPFFIDIYRQHLTQEIGRAHV